MMNYKIITSTISLLLIGSVFAVALEPGLTYGYVQYWYYPNNNQSSYGYGYGYEDEEDNDEYGYGTTTTPSDASTPTTSTSSDTASTTTTTDSVVVETVPADSTSEQTTDQTIETDHSCSVDRPSHLKARHQKNRIVLRWRGSDEICPSTTVAGYIVRVTTKSGKLVLRTDQLGQSHYIIRHKKLKMNKTYRFVVRTVSETGEKTKWSKEKRFKMQF